MVNPKKASPRQGLGSSGLHSIKAQNVLLDDFLTADQADKECNNFAKEETSEFIFTSYESYKAWLNAHSIDGREEK